MAGILKVDQVQSDSNLAFNIAGSNVAFLNATSLQVVSSNVSLAGTNVFTSGKLVTSAQPTGAVLQVVSTVKTDTFSTSSTSFVDITGMSVTITPTSATSKILVFINLTVGHAASNYSPVNLVRNGTNIAQPTTASDHIATLNNYAGEGSGITAGSAQPQYALSFLDSPSSTSALTYKLQIRTTGVTTYVNTRPVAQNGTTVSTLTLMEIAA